METRVLFELGALAAAFGCAYALFALAAAGMRRRSAAIAAQGGSVTAEALMAWRVRNGFRALVPLADALARITPVAHVADEAVMAFERRGWLATRASALSVLLVVGVLASAAVGVIAGGVIPALATAACIACASVVVAGNARDKRREAVREAVPDAIESMAACFGSGFTLMQTFREVAKDVRGPLAQTFARSAHVLEMGGSAEESLAQLREGAHASELAFVAVALDVQHQSGGAMRQVLDAAADTVKGELALRRALRVQTAQAKLSARIVVVMPFILVAAFSLATPDFLAPFFSSALGYGLLSLAIVMQVGGVVLVRRALSVEGVS